MWYGLWVESHLSWESNGQGQAEAGPMSQEQSTDVSRASGALLLFRDKAWSQQWATRPGSASRDHKLGHQLQMPTMNGCQQNTQGSIRLITARYLPDQLEWWLSRRMTRLQEPSPAFTVRSVINSLNRDIPPLIQHEANLQEEALRQPGHFYLEEVLKLVDQTNC